MKIYLAGKIKDVPNWRASIVDMDRWHVKSYSYSTWDVLERAIFGAHDYTGPYWASHHNEFSTHADNTSYSDIEDDDRAQIVKNCCLAVSTSDLVFARLMDNYPDPSWGTVAEVAWAWQRRIPVIGYGDLDEDTWFVRQMCTAWYDRARGSEADALRAHLKLVDYHAYIKSDVWKKFAAAIKEERGGRCQVCNRSGHLDAHHRTYERLGWESPDDITVLCRGCHELYETTRRTKAARNGA